LDRRPPTLLRQFTFLQLPAQTLQPSPHLLILPSTTRHGSFPTLLTSPPLRSHELHLLPFVDGAPDALLRVARGARPVDLEHVRLQSFVRTPDGSAIASIRHDGGGEIYVRDKSGRIRATGSWDGVGVEQIVLFDRGNRHRLESFGPLLILALRSKPCSLCWRHSQSSSIHTRHCQAKPDHVYRSHTPFYSPSPHDAFIFIHDLHS
jgi:rabconnectin-3a